MTPIDIELSPPVKPVSESAITVMVDGGHVIFGYRNKGNLTWHVALTPEQAASLGRALAVAVIEAAKS